MAMFKRAGFPHINIYQFSSFSLNSSWDISDKTFLFLPYIYEDSIAENFRLFMNLLVLRRTEYYLTSFEKKNNVTKKIVNK